MQQEQEQTTELRFRDKALYKLSQYRLLVSGLFMVMFLFFTTMEPTYAAPGGENIKKLGNTIWTTLQSYGLILAAIMIPVGLIVWLILTMFGGFKPAWKKKGMEIAVGAMIGGIGIAALSLIVPALMDFINGLGGDKLEAPTSTSK